MLVARYTVLYAERVVQEIEYIIIWKHFTYCTFFTVGILLIYLTLYLPSSPCLKKWTNPRIYDSSPDNSCVFYLHSAVLLYKPDFEVLWF